MPAVIEIGENEQRVLKACQSSANDFLLAQGMGRGLFAGCVQFGGEGLLECLSGFSSFFPQNLHHLGHQQLVPPWAGTAGAEQHGWDTTSPEPKPLPQGHFNGNAGRSCAVSSWVNGSVVTVRWLCGWTCCSNSELDLKSSRAKL